MEGAGAGERAFLSGDLGDRIFLTTALDSLRPLIWTRSAQGRRGGFGGGGGPQAEQKLMVLAFDRKTGKQLWEKTAIVATPHEGFHSQYGSFASPSVLVDKKHAIAFFGSRGVYCYTHDGQLVWEKDFGVQMRMLMSFGEGRGRRWTETRWCCCSITRATRCWWRWIKTPGANSGARHGRPAVPGPGPADHFSRRAETGAGCCEQLVAGYDLENGKLIWQTTGLGRNVIPMPVVADGVAIVMSGYQSPNLLAIRLGREGDLTGTDAILWQNQRGNSYTPSPVLHEGKLYMLTDNGTISCFDAKTGKPFYSAGEASQDVQLQVIAGRRQRQALHGGREWT